MAKTPVYTRDQIKFVLIRIYLGYAAGRIIEEYEAKWDAPFNKAKLRYIKGKYGQDPKYGTILINGTFKSQTPREVLAHEGSPTTSSEDEYEPKRRKTTHPGPQEQPVIGPGAPPLPKIGDIGPDGALTLPRTGIEPPAPFRVPELPRYPQGNMMLPAENQGPYSGGQARGATPYLPPHHALHLSQMRRHELAHQPSQPGQQTASYLTPSGSGFHIFSAAPQQPTGGNVPNTAQHRQKSTSGTPRTPVKIGGFIFDDEDDDFYDATPPGSPAPHPQTAAAQPDGASNRGSVAATDATIELPAHVQTLLSTVGPRYATTPDAWIGDGIQPAMMQWPAAWLQRTQQQPNQGAHSPASNTMAGSPELQSEHDRAVERQTQIIGSLTTTIRSQYGYPQPPAQNNPAFHPALSPYLMGTPAPAPAPGQAQHQHQGSGPSQEAALPRGTKRTREGHVLPPELAATEQYEYEQQNQLLDPHVFFPEVFESQREEPELDDSIDPFLLYEGNAYLQEGFEMLAHFNEQSEQAPLNQFTLGAEPTQSEETRLFNQSDLVLTEAAAATNPLSDLQNGTNIDEPNNNDTSVSILDSFDPIADDDDDWERYFHPLTDEELATLPFSPTEGTNYTDNPDIFSIQGPPSQTQSHGFQVPQAEFVPTEEYLAEMSALQAGDDEESPGAENIGAPALE